MHVSPRIDIETKAGALFFGEGSMNTHEALCLPPATAAEKQSGVMLRLICHIGRLSQSDPKNLVPDDRHFGCSYLAHLVGDQRKLRLAGRQRAPCSSPRPIKSDAGR